MFGFSFSDVCGKFLLCRRYPHWQLHLTWQQALDFVAGINDGTYYLCGAGHTDWRLPNVRALLSLADFGVGWDRDHPFVNQYGSYWSSTTRSSDKASALEVNSESGFIRSSRKDRDVNHVWLVRGGQ